METEIFKNIEGYEGIYQVSNLGNVKSLNYHRTGKEQIMKLSKTKRGYLKIVLYKNNIKKTYRVHRLVADAFIFNPNNLPCINHKDEEKTNNRVENLEWISYKDNSNYGNRNKRMIQTRNKLGLPKAEKPVFQLTKNGIEIGKYKSIAEAERQTGISHSSIYNCCKGKLKSAGGFIWRYA